MARWGLSRLKEKKERVSRHELDMDRALGTAVEFLDPYLERDHPYVSPRLLQRLSDIDKNLVLCWELQFYFEHRWHVKLMDQGELKSVLLLQDPPYPIKVSQDRAEYVPFDSRSLRNLERLMHQLRHGNQRAAVDAHLQKERNKIDTREKDYQSLAADMDVDFRRINERIIGKRNISDPGWERGIGFKEDGTPFIEGAGAHSGKTTKAI